MKYLPLLLAATVHATAEDLPNANLLPTTKAIHEKIAAKPDPKADEMKGYQEAVPLVEDGAIEMLPIPAGTFKIGSPESEAKRGEDEGPQKEIAIEPFWMAKVETTWDVYRAYMENGKSRNKDGTLNRDADMTTFDDIEIKDGETLIDTALTLNAMRPDLLVVRHPQSGAVDLLSQKVNCAVLNAGDGRHEHPTQALLDALTIRRAKGRLHRLSIAICGDIAHSRVARSNIMLLGKMENRIRLIAPPTLMPTGIADFGCEVFDDMRAGLAGADVVMMLRLQKERMDGGFIPSEREYYHRYGLDAEKLGYAKPDAIVMHPGPMNRGVEIDGTIADDINRSVIQTQVEMGVAVRMAAMDLLARNLRAARGAAALGVMV